MPCGSWQNKQYANMQSPTPEVGMGATKIGWTDRHAYTIIKVISSKRIVIQRDEAVRTDKNGMSEVQSYEFIQNPEAPEIEATLRKDGLWKIKGTTSVVLIGEKMEYYDYSF